MISLFSIFKKGKKRIKKKENNNRSIITDILVNEEAKLPYIVIRINNKDYKVMLDSGASTSVFDISVLKEFKKECELELVNTDEMVTGFGDTQDVEIYNLPLIINDRLYFTDIAFANLGLTNHLQETYNLKLIGVLGMDFFIKYKCILNFYDKKLYGIFNNKNNENK